MRSQCPRAALVSFALLVTLFPVAAAADQLIMKNGDVISGEVTKIAENKIYINPSYADEYAIDLAEVESIEAEKVFEVELDQSHRSGSRDSG